MGLLRREKTLKDKLVVWDVSNFAEMHPGGVFPFFEYAGKDATDAFYGLHRQEVLVKYAPRLKIGVIANEKPQIEIPAPDAISKVPYAEPSYWMGFKSPYFKQVFFTMHKHIEADMIVIAVKVTQSSARLSAGYTPKSRYNNDTMMIYNSWIQMPRISFAYQWV